MAGGAAVLGGVRGVGSALGTTGTGAMGLGRGFGDGGYGTTPGVGGLGDPNSRSFKLARDAMAMSSNWKAESKGVPGVDGGTGTAPGSGAKPDAGPGTAGSGTGLQSQPPTAGGPKTNADLAKTVLSSFVKGAGVGLVGGFAENLKEGAKMMHLGPLAGMAGDAARKIQKMPSEVGRIEGGKFVDRYTGGISSGVIPFLAQKGIPTDEIPGAVAGGKKFASDISAMASQRRYSDIADSVNSYLQFPFIHDKERFGEYLADNVSALSKDDMALGRFYHNLNEMAGQGGVKSLPEDFVQVGKNAGFYNDLLQTDSGITLPESPFGIGAMSWLPELQEQALTFQQGYQLKGTLANVVENEPAIPEVDVLKGTKILSSSKGPSEVAKQYVDTVTEGYGISNALKKRMLTETANVVGAYDPETIGKLSRVAQTRQIGKHMTVEPGRIKAADTSAPLPIKRIFAGEEPEESQREGAPF